MPDQNHPTPHDRAPAVAADLRERVGISITAPDVPTLLASIAEAETQGVRQLWMTQGPTTFDALTVYAVALAQTRQIRFGTSIVPTYPRHPLALAQQAATAAAVGPGRLRLGVGPSHRPAIEQVYGLSMEAPLAHLREYLEVLRAALWTGNVDHHGRFLTAKATFANPPRVPLLMSALGAGAFHLAGAVADGAISWNCPMRYLLEVARPALQGGAQGANRPVPPLVAHVWVALSADAPAVRRAAQQVLAGYARLPFYAQMFAAAGYPVTADAQVSNGLIDTLVVMGDAAAVAARVRDLLAAGLDELLLTHVPLGEASAERTQLFQVVGHL
jgi:F420-dependent oxidoreductase-like protein